MLPDIITGEPDDHSQNMKLMLGTALYFVDDVQPHIQFGDRYVCGWSRDANMVTPPALRRWGMILKVVSFLQTWAAFSEREDFHNISETKAVPPTSGFRTVRIETILANFPLSRRVQRVALGRGLKGCIDPVSLLTLIKVECIHFKPRLLLLAFVTSSPCIDLTI